MYLASLDLFGFKSFANRTHINFLPGVTAIVGPNGCGKSNLVDAVRWVLGEQREATLRSDRMENVIFGGTGKRRPLGLAEISLTLHDTDGILPVEYEEVTVTRRLFRSGKSEYLLNKNLCRLRDFTDLFMGTGISAESYSIIELKMVEDILSENPDVLRRLLDEAIGITRYKLRRKEALRKLDEARQDSERAQDILYEVDHQAKSLQRQVAKVRSYNRLKVKAERIRAAIVWAQVQDLESRLHPLAERLTHLKQELEVESAALTTAETELIHLETEGLQQEEERSQLAGHFATLQADYQAKLNDKIRQEEEWRSGGWKLEKDAEEMEKISSELSALAEHRQEAEKGVQALHEQLPALRERLSQVQTAFEQTDAHYKEMRAAAKAGHEKLNVVRLKETEALRHLERREAQRQSLQDRLTTLSDRQKEQDYRLASKSVEADTIQARLDQQVQKATAIRNQKRGMEEQIESSKKQILALQRDLDQNQARQMQIQMQVKHLDELRWRGSPLFSAGGDLAKKFPKQISAMLGDELEVDEFYVRAVETALLGMSYCRLMEPTKSLEEVLTFVQQEGSGQAALLMGEPPHFSREAAQRFAAQHQGKALADLIPEGTIISRWTRYLVRQGVLLSSAKDLRKLGEKAADQGLVLVTPSGEFTDGRGFWIVSGAKAEPPKVKGISSRLQEWAKQETKAETHQGEIQQELTQRQQELEAKSDELRRLQEILSDMELTSEKEAHLKLQVEAERVSAQLLLEQVKRERQELETEWRELLARQDDAQLELPTVSDLLRNLESHQPLQEEMEAKALQEREAVWQQLTQAQLEHERLQSQWQRAQERASDLKRREEELKTRQSSLAEEVQGLTHRRDELQKSLQSQKVVHEDLAGQLLEQRQKLENFDLNRREWQESQRNYNIRVRDSRARMEKISQEVHGTELQSVEFAATLREERKKLEGLDLENLKDEPAEADLLAKLEKKIASLEPLNLAAESEYNELLNRLNFLNDQLQDLKQAEADLQNTITTLNKEARERFEAGFGRLKENLQRIFSEVFEGGQAELRLVVDDPLESRVELLAAPPGKRVGSLTLLSGGEKALTAISLLFAIYLEKPSPFCILDEVDAPLDDENTGRFCRILKSFTEKTQFLVITHNKRTMTEAAQLLGITMEEEGISRVVPVKLNEALSN